MPKNELEELKSLTVENNVAIKLLTEDIQSVKKYMKIRTWISVTWVVLFILSTLLAALSLPGIISGYTSNFPAIMDTVKLLY